MRIIKILLLAVLAMLALRAPASAGGAIQVTVANGADDSDQRGTIRPLGPAADVGSVEILYPPTPTATQTPTKPSCGGIPPVPQLKKPVDMKQVKGPVVTLKWSQATCAHIFKVIIRKGSRTGKRFHTERWLNNPEFRIQSLPAGQTFAWRVIAVNSQGKSKSEWWTFTVK